MKPPPLFDHYMSTQIGSQDLFGDHVFQLMVVLYYATRSTVIHFFFIVIVI